MRRYQDINPYYHYARAQKAYHDKQYEDTLAELRHAIRLRSDESVFYALQGQALTALGREGDAAKSFARATENQRSESVTRTEAHTEPRAGPSRASLVHDGNAVLAPYYLPPHE